MFAVLSVVCGLCIAPTSTAAAGPCDIAVRSDDLDYDSFEAAAALRLPGTRLRVADGSPDAACAGELHAYVNLRLDGDDRWELSLILSDGRAWYRSVEASADEAPRGLASVLANLLAAVDETGLAADAAEVELPAKLADRQEHDQAAQPEAEFDSDQLDEPKPDSDEPVDEPERAAEADEPSPVVLELGPRLAGAVVLGLAPGPGLRGSGGGVGLDLRLRDGLGFGFDVRALTLSAAGVSLTRLRIGLGLGVISRTGRFEIPVMFAGIVEPWVAREAGVRVPLAQPPMIGGGVRVAPGLLLPVGGVQLRIGLALGFEIAVEAAAGALTPAIARDPTSAPILRAGGVELSAALEIGVWVPVRGRCPPLCSTRRGRTQSATTRLRPNSLARYSR